MYDVHIHTCMCVYTNLSLSLYVYIYIYVYVSLSLYIYIYIYTHVYQSFRRQTETSSLIGRKRTLRLSRRGGELAHVKSDLFLKA